MKHIKLVLTTLALLLFVSAVPDKTTTIFIIGDSTAAKKDTTGGKQERGWGMMLQQCFDTNYIVVDNHAVYGKLMVLLSVALQAKNLMSNLVRIINDFKGISLHLLLQHHFSLTLSIPI